MDAHVNAPLDKLVLRLNNRKMLVLAIHLYYILLLPDKK
nr:MAG TPA: hypothetical protein [Bacteriophage sp.]